MSLIVNNEPVTDRETQEIPSAKRWAVVCGFGRRRDAEIARDAIIEICGGEPDTPEELMGRLEAAGYASKKKLMRFICERLQW